MKVIGMVIPNKKRNKKNNVAGYLWSIVANSVLFSINIYSLHIVRHKGRTEVQTVARRGKKGGVMQLREET